MGTLRLCYVDPRTRLAWFTSAPLAAQRGDDWDDGWHGLNAGPPDELEGHDYLSLGWDGPLETAADHYEWGRLSVDEINAQGRPWLWSVGAQEGGLAAGATVAEFAAYVWRHGGDVYLPWRQLERVRDMLTASSEIATIYADDRESRILEP